MPFTFAPAPRARPNEPVHPMKLGHLPPLRIGVNAYSSMKHYLDFPRLLAHLHGRCRPRGQVEIRQVMATPSKGRASHRRRRVRGPPGPNNR
jgi:hypothetical protein